MNSIDTLPVLDQDVANLVAALYTPNDPEWYDGLLLYVAEHADDPTLPITLKAALEYNSTFDSAEVLQ